MQKDLIQNPRPQNIDILFHSAGGRNTARYVSDLVVREEALQKGRMVGLYWSATGQVQRENQLDSFPGYDVLSRQSAVFELEMDGMALNDHWEWVEASQRNGEKSGTVEAVVELRHQVRPVTVKMVTRLDGSPVLARWLEITNTGDQPATISHLSPWAGLLWNTEAMANPAWNEKDGVKFSLGYLAAEKWGQEGDLVWRPLTAETCRLERTHGHSFAAPYWVLRNHVTGECCFLALAWSGNTFAEFACHDATCLSFRLGPLGPAPLRVVEAGETVCSPEIHLGLFHSSYDAAVQGWYRHLRTSVIPPRPAGKEMYTIAARVVELPDEWILREIDIAAEMGIEAFSVDAGWYGEQFASWVENRGDWFDGSWMPGGIAGVRDYTHKKGLMFGLWMEPEAISAKSRLAKEHPDWMLRGSDGRSFGILNLANPDAARYFEESVLRVISDYKLDFYKLDYNTQNLEGGQNRIGSYLEHETWRHNEVVHRVYDRVRREFPQVALENCAGGGGRNDLGMLARFHYACESDWSIFPFSIRAINTMTLFLPPEAICYYHNHLTTHAHLVADLDTHLRVTLFANPIYVGFGAQNADRSTPYFTATRRYIELAKTFCRPILANQPVVYHHTPDIGLLRPADWCVLEYASPDHRQGYAGIFRLSSKAGGDIVTEYLFRPRGLDLSLDYEVTLDNRRATCRIPGRELVMTGLPIHLDAALTSELVLFRAVE